MRQEQHRDFRDLEMKRLGPANMWQFHMTILGLITLNNDPDQHRWPNGDLDDDAVDTFTGVPASYPDPLMNLLDRCLQNDPNDRDTGAEVSDLARSYIDGDPNAIPPIIARGEGMQTGRGKRSRFPLRISKVDRYRIGLSMQKTPNLLAWSQKVKKTIRQK